MSVDTAQPCTRDAVAELISIARERESAMFTEAEGKSLLSAFGIDTPRGIEIAVGQIISDDIREPLVVKAISSTLVHKSDAGGVRVGVRRDEIDEVAARMGEQLAAAGHRLNGLLVEEMVPSGHEVIVGAVRAPGLGWTVMVGLGGVLVEIFEDVAFGLAPLANEQILAMLHELRGMKVLDGARGGERADIPALVTLISRLAGPNGLLQSLPDDVIEIDLNPVIVSGTRAVAVDARFVVGPVEVAESAREDDDGRATDFTPLFHPRRIAVLGASGQRPNLANRFIRNILGGGFDGTIVPIHPTSDSIEGLPAVRSLSEVDQPIDYAFVALPATRVGEALSRGAGRVRFAQVVSSGFGEVEEGQDLEKTLVQTVRDAGIRLIGPNCLGTHASAGRLSFVPDAPLTPGTTAVVSQSGGLSVDILRVGSLRGIDFHSVVSIGNGADVTAAELVESALRNDEVRVIGLYLESLAAAREVLDVLTQAEMRKPVVLLAGGRTSEGSRAATSHTGALAGNHRLWPAIARQAGMTLVDSLEDFATALHALSTLDLRVKPNGRDAVLFGNGGGASVLGADALERQGLATPPLADSVVEELDDLGLPPGNGLRNPIDVPAGTLAVKSGAIAKDVLAVVLAGSEPAVLISHLNVGIIQRNLGETHGDVTGTVIDSIAGARDEATSNTHQLLVLKTDGSADTEALIKTYAHRARTRGIPVFPAFEDAALAARAVLEQGQRTYQASRDADGR
ncbi:acetate--CoA ligase family protein [Rhodococcus opacus]|uniref:Acetate--CoA ligase family protein n=1 Tax=Rhodococcus opacus TaxID=37919 RepID=A0AAX3YBL3_RHOOP|nr:acetate--CoA ligase family protein [Rhodococcus opacus]MCZ4586743.1 acetate--CoA ligase family protein [Rhodococcus opacus]MDV6243522.1 acetate--CoA ligase family protein [Rhodococcus opacus]WKN55145.1 acetate--CoA ligase family protein [Rhodococcus opacus]WLF46608.1 acetate--CoA ligase family protein [Rhodococcus opacus]